MFGHQAKQMVGPKLSKYGPFHPLDVVGCGIAIHNFRSGGGGFKYDNLAGKGLTCLTLKR